MCRFFGPPCIIITLLQIFHSVLVKEFRKLVNNWQRYGQKKSARFSGPTLSITVPCLCDMILIINSGDEWHTRNVGLYFLHRCPWSGCFCLGPLMLVLLQYKILLDLNGQCINIHIRCPVVNLVSITQLTWCSAMGIIKNKQIPQSNNAQITRNNPLHYPLVKSCVRGHISNVYSSSVYGKKLERTCDIMYLNVCMKTSSKLGHDQLMYCI